MKKRRTLIVALLLVAALALGIGYAGFTSELLINGDAVMNATTTSLVNIKDVVISEKNGDIELNASGQGTKTVNADLTGFSTSQDYVVLTVTVENPHEFEVTLSAPTLTAQNNEVTPGGDNYFEIEILNPTAIPTTLPAAEYVSGTLTPSTITFQYKISASTIPADAHTVSYTITANATTR